MVTLIFLIMFTMTFMLKYEIESIFDFVPQTAEEMYGYMENMDMTTSSFIDGVNMKICKTALDAVPNKLRHLFVTSLFSGEFPTQWTFAYVT